MERTIAEHIVITPGTCGGRPRIAGHRIRVQDIVAWHENQGQTAEQIVADFPQLSLADVHAALAYYYDHRDEIRKHVEEDEKTFQEFKKKNPLSLTQKLRRRNAHKDSLPSR